MAFTQYVACCPGPRIADEGRLCDVLAERKLDTKADRVPAVPGRVISGGDATMELRTWLAAAS